MKTRINITIDPEVVEELDRMAKNEGRSRSGMVERLVRSWGVPPPTPEAKDPTTEPWEESP